MATHRSRLLLVGLPLALALAALPSAAGAVVAEPDRREWLGEPAMISNVGVYRAGEFIFQDYLYDDHGANTDGIERTDAPIGGGLDPSDPTDPDLGSTGGQIRHAGDFMYAADDSGYYANVADLIEFRVAADEDDVHYLIRLGALSSPDDAVVGICVDEDGDAGTGIDAWPFGAGLEQQLGCDTHYTVYGTGAHVTDADGTHADLADIGGSISADVAGNTIELRVPRSVADPQGATWRYFVGSGLWDSASGRWLQVPVTPSTPGAPEVTGGGVGVPQIWDLLSNNDEPNTYWREERQANDLTAHDISDHHVDVDFTRLADPRDDPEPRLTGVINRIYVAEHPMTPNQGIRYQAVALGPRNYIYYGDYQPYALAIPSTYWAQLDADPTTRLPFDTCLHPLNGNHHTEIYYAEVEAQPNYVPGVTGTVEPAGLGFSVFEERVDRQNQVYACVNGRGEGVGYTGGDGMVDALEVMADVQRRYRIDPDRRYLHGISLGAIGTWYMATLYPDRFAAVLPSIFSPGFSCDTPTLGNLYNVPVLYTLGTGDQFGQGAFGDCVADQLEGFESEYVYYQHLARFHELSLGDVALPFSEALMYTRTRVENPARVRHRYDAARFSPKVPGDGTVYWVSGLTPRDGAGEIDVTSLGRADELPRDQVVFEGLYEHTDEGYQARFRGLLRLTPEEFAEVWRPEVLQPGWRELALDARHEELPAEAVANAFRLEARSLEAVALDLQRMALDDRRLLTAAVRGDGTLSLTLLGRFPSSTRATLDGRELTVRTTGDGITVDLALTEEPAALQVIPPAARRP
jgi:hypothetical protein